MKNNLIKVSLFLIIFIGIVFCTSVQAVNIPEIETIEYSEEYKEYMALSDEEKAERTEPSRYNVISPKTNSEYLSNLNNIFKSATLVKSGLDSEYDLRDIISQNVAIRNQMNTNYKCMLGFCYNRSFRKQHCFTRLQSWKNRKCI